MRGAPARLGDGPAPLLLLGGGLLLGYGLLFAGPYGERLLTQAGVFALLVMGYQFIFGHAGAFSLAQGAFFGIGAYVTGILGSQAGWGFAATFPLSVLLPLVLAAAVALPVLRLQSHYFALATLALAQLALLAAINWQDLTGGANGLPGVPGIALLGLEIDRGRPLLAFVWALVGAGGLAAWRFGRGANGLTYRLMREAPLAAGAAGIDAGRLRFTAFLMSAAYGGAAGALNAHTVGVVSPAALGFPVMIACLTMTVIGGPLRVAGAILGAVLLVHLPEWVRPLEQHYLIAYGVGALVMIVLAPEGLAGLIERLRPAAPAPLPAPLVLPSPAAAKPGAGPLLEVRDLDKAFGGVVALEGVDLTLGSGEILGLVGPNGSGKTTLANLVTGLGAPDRGRILFRGRDIAGRPAYKIARAGIARSFQTPLLIDALPALDNIAAAGCAAGCGLATARARALGALERLGAADLAAVPAGTLPHGLRRRVEIGRALALAPRLMILDEPAAGLAAAERDDLARLLRELAADGMALVVIEHDMTFLLALADRVACLDRGRIVARGSPAALRRDAALAAAYFGAPEAVG